MKKSILRAVFPIVLALVLLFAGTGTKAYAGFISFGIKLSGGAGFLLNGGGDLETTRLGWEAYNTAWIEPYYTSTFDWTKNSLALDFRGEFILKFGNNFGVGFGAGYLGQTSKGNYILSYDRTYSYWWGNDHFFNDDAYDNTYKVTAIPITINFYFFVPMGSISLYGYVGPSLNFGSYTNDMVNNYNWELDELAFGDHYYWTYDETVTQKTTAKSTAIGFQGGIGFEFALGPFISLGIEGYGRYLNFGDWNGDETEDGVWNEDYFGATDSGSWTDSWSGPLWNYDYYEGWAGESFNRTRMDSVQPSGSNYSNVRKAKINFNTVGGQFCIIIHF